MLRTIHLHGKLKKQFGPQHRFDVRTAGEALRALNCAFPGAFVGALQTGSYKLVRGDKRAGMHLDIDLVSSFNLGMADLHMIPVAAGAGNGKGIGKAILGSVLIGAAIFMSGGTLATPLASAGLLSGVSWGNIAVVGLGMALSGVSSLMSNPDKAAPPKTDSFSISGPTNMGQQGSAIQLIYGECIVAPTCVSFDADIEDIGAYRGATASLGFSLQPFRTPDGLIGYFGAGA
jgi:predicted phage tail protein